MAPTWSFYVYVAGDNDLSNVVLGDVAEMEKADSAIVNVVMQLDLPGAITVRRVLTGAGFVTIPSPDLLINANTGDPATLTAFLQAAKAERNSEHTAVIISGHGTGFVNFTFEALAAVTTA